jgi:hypothetical protein
VLPAAKPLVAINSPFSGCWFKTFKPFNSFKWSDGGGPKRFERSAAIERFERLELFLNVVPLPHAFGQLGR